MIQAVIPAYGEASASAVVVMGVITVSRGIQLILDQWRKNTDE